MAAPPGNQFAARARVWRDAISKALETRTISRTDGKRELDALAEKLIDACSTGDLVALKELGDRLDGKPAQAIIGDPEQPLTVSHLGLVPLARK